MGDVFIMNRASQHMANLLNDMREVGSKDVIMVGDGPASKFVNAAASDTIEVIRRRIKEEELGQDWPKLLGTVQRRSKPGGKSQGKARG